MKLKRHYFWVNWLKRGVPTWNLRIVKEEKGLVWSETYFFLIALYKYGAYNLSHGINERTRAVSTRLHTTGSRARSHKTHHRVRLG